MVDVALTTFDNPHDPFEEWDKWRAFDVAKGYYTCEYLARIEQNNHDLSEAEQLAASEAAIDEIVALNLSGMYKKVVKVA